MENTAEQINTKDRILEAAEILFSDIGFNGTSMRAITRQADVSLALVNYHFGSKELLLKAVIERRVLPVNEARRRRISLLEEEYGEAAPPIEEVVRALVEPFVQQVNEVDRFMRVCAVVNHIKSPSAFWNGFWSENFNDIVQRSMAMLKRGLPEVSDEGMAWRVHFLCSCMYDALARLNRMDIIVEGARTSYNADRFLDEMIAFVTAGFQGAKGGKR